MTRKSDMADVGMRKQLSFKTLSCISIFALCFVITINGHSSMNYREIAKLGSRCPGLDSCMYQRLTSGSLSTPTKESNCACDYLCDEYNDCCIDAPRNMNSNTDNLKCLEVKEIGGVYMKDTCPPFYRDPANIRQLCERTEIGDQADPLGSMPVTDPLTGLTYKNYYCSMCNDKSDQVVMCKPKLECPLLSLLNTSNTITSKYVLQNLINDGQRWGLYLDDESDGSPFFHDCNVYPVLPQALEGNVRLCKANLISDCPPSWEDDQVRRMCKSYMGARYIFGKYGYRNVHCALCNGANAAQLSCVSDDDMDIFREFGLHSFAVLLDISSKSGGEVGKIKVCTVGEVFDPFFNRCRPVICLPGFVRRGKKCVMSNPMMLSKFFAKNKIGFFFTSTTKLPQISINITRESEELSSTSGVVTSTIPTV